MEVTKTAVAACKEISSLAYSEGYYYGCTEENPARLLKINESDITDQQVLSLQSYRGYDLEIVGDIIYVILYDQIELVDKSAFTRLATIIPCPPEALYGGKSLLYISPYLYAGWEGKDPTPPALSKIDVGTNAIIATETYVPAGGILDHIFRATRTDGTYIYSVDSGRVIKVEPGTLALVDDASIAFGFGTNEIVLHSDYIYIASYFYASKAITKVRKDDFLSYTHKELPSRLNGVGSEGSGVFALSATTESIWELDFDLNVLSELVLPSPLSMPEQIAFGANGKALVSTGQDPSYLAIIQVSVAPTRTVTINSVPVDATVSVD